MVVTFLYGSFMSPSILRSQGLNRDTGPMEIASLRGYDVFFSPSVNLTPSPGGIVYGVLGDFTPEECAILFSQKRFSTWKEAQITVRKKDDGEVFAICHFDSGAARVQPTREYLERLVQIAKSYRFPPPYIERMRMAALASNAEFHL